MNWLKKKLADFFRCKRGINKKALKLKKSWDEVSAILTFACLLKRKKKCGLLKKITPKK